MPIFRRENGLLAAVPGNYAILDDNGFLPGISMNPVVEDYINHNGNTDNFMETNTGGTGTAVENSALHRMDLSTGLDDESFANYITKKTYIPSLKSLIFVATIQNYNPGNGGIRRVRLGFSTEPESFSPEEAVMFVSTNNMWSVGAGSESSQTIDPLQNGDNIVIVVNGSKAIFYVNGLAVAKVTEGLPTLPLYAGCMIWITSTYPGDDPVDISIDYISIKQYK